MTARRYHHGDVRAAALAAALELLEQEGEGAITMRAVAKAVGVDHRALYRHFPDRDAILSALATQGHEALLTQMRSTFDAAGLLFASFAAQVRFALARPHLHGLMLSRPREVLDADPDLNAAVFAVLDHLMDGAREALGEAADDSAAKSLAFAGLSSAYGMVSLAATRSLAPREPDAQEAFLIEQVRGVLEGQIARLKA